MIYSAVFPASDVLRIVVSAIFSRPEVLKMVPKVPKPIRKYALSICAMQQYALKHTETSCGAFLNLVQSAQVGPASVMPRGMR